MNDMETLPMYSTHFVVLLRDGISVWLSVSRRIECSAMRRHSTGKVLIFNVFFVRAVRFGYIVTTLEFRQRKPLMFFEQQRNSNGYNFESNRLCTWMMILFECIPNIYVHDVGRDRSFVVTVTSRCGPPCIFIIIISHFHDDRANDSSLQNHLKTTHKRSTTSRRMNAHYDRIKAGDPTKHHTHTTHKSLELTIQ